MNKINGNGKNYSNSLENMLKPSLWRKKIKDYRNHSYDVENVKERPAGKKFAYQRENQNFKISKYDMKIFIAFITDNNYRVKKCA
jgi:hypothetical protein